MEELKTKLENIVDTYEDFVEGILCHVKNNKDYQEKVLNLINSNSQITTSEIISYVAYLRGL